MFVPARATAVLQDSPVRGAVGEIDAARAFAHDVADDATAYGCSVWDAQVAVLNCDSRGLATIGAKLAQRLIPGADLLRESALGAAAAFAAYASEIERIHGDAARCERAVDDALAVIRAQAARIEEIASSIRVPTAYSWNAAPPGTLPEPVLGGAGDRLDADERGVAVQLLRSRYEAEWLGAASLWHTAIADIGSAGTRWAALIEERRSAEIRLRATLADTTIGQLISVSDETWSARRFTVATAVSGELWGRQEAGPGLEEAHPLLRKLIGVESGAGIWQMPPEPGGVAAAWSGLTAEEQRRLISEVPGVIGNLPGLPFSVRDEANRVAVEYFQRYPHELSADQLMLLAEVRSILKAEERQREEFGTGLPPIQLIAFAMTGEVPKVAVGYGDLDAARQITWAVPGMNSDAHLGLAGWDQSSRNLHAAQRSELRLTGADTDANDAGGGIGGLDAGADADQQKNAVVAWLGYDSPDLPWAGDLGVLHSHAAEAGAARLAAELDGAHAARSAGDIEVPMVNVLSHSYGTTLATIALTLVEHPVDTVILLGSAGLDTDLVANLDEMRVEEFSPGQRAVFTTHAAADRLAPLGAAASRRGQPNPDARAVLGYEQYSPVYAGALSFSAEGDAALGLAGTDGHSAIGEGDAPGPLGMHASAGHGYLDPRTQSLHSVAQITTGRMSAELAGSLTRSESQRVRSLPGFDIGWREQR